MVALALWHMTLQPGEKMPILVRKDFQITNASFGREVEGEGRSVVVVQHQPVNPRYLGSESGSDSEYSGDSDDEDEELDSDEEAADEAELAGETSKLSNGSAKKGGKKAAEEEDDEDMEEDDEDEEFDSDDEDFQAHVEAVVCALIPGKIEQVSLNLTFVQDEVVVFEVTGKNEVHLMGNYIDQSEHNHGHDHDGMRDDYDDLVGSDSDDYEDDEEEDSDDDGEDEELTSEQEAELMAYFNGKGKKGKSSSRIELLEDSEDKKVNELPTKKRKAETQNPDDSIVSNAKSAINTAATKAAEVAKTVTDAVTGAGKETKEAAEELTKTQKKKLNKKLKTEGGKGVEADIKTKEAAPAPKEEKKEEKKAEKKGPTKKTLAGGLIVEDVKIGDGQVAKSGKRLGMRYIGKLQNGKQFDANTNGPAFNFRLGSGEVIKGWDQGLVGMAVGGERRLTIPAGLAYGSQKIPGIPPNSTLTFDVKLLTVK